ncbi:MAG: hypothetical protein AAF089_05975 [Bacteroidota bacterium]
MKAFALLLATLLLAGPALAQDEGIHVLGTWSLSVYNADGSLDESVEFTNDLTRNGANLLINLFTKRNRLATLVLEVGNSQLNEKPCRDSSGAFVNCLIIEPEDPLSGDPETSELTIEKLTEADGSDFVLARFSGTISAVRDVDINFVGSRVGSCLYNVAEPCTVETRSNLQSGAESFGSVFTARVLDTPLAVAEGQSVDVTFELSFDY